MERNKFTEADYAEWQRLYLEGLSSHDIAKKYDAIASTVRRRLTTLGVVMRPIARPLKGGGYVDSLMLATWQQDYEQGLASYEIGDKFGVAASTVIRRLKKAGIEIRHDTQRQSFSDPFAKMSPDGAWLLGLLYTDGNLQRERMRLASNDLDMLEKAAAIFAEYGTSGSISMNHIGKSACQVLQVNSVELVEHVRKYGLYERKSLTLIWPEFLERTYWSHFLRGCFDGDGYIGLSGKKNVDKLRNRLSRLCRKHLRRYWRGDWLQTVIMETQKMEFLSSRIIQREGRKIWRMAI